MPPRTVYKIGPGVFSIKVQSRFTEFTVGTLDNYIRDVIFTSLNFKEFPANIKYPLIFKVEIETYSIDKPDPKAEIPYKYRVYKDTIHRLEPGITADLIPTKDGTIYNLYVQCPKINYYEEFTLFGTYCTGPAASLSTEDTEKQEMTNFFFGKGD